MCKNSSAPQVLENQKQKKKKFASSQFENEYKDFPYCIPIWLSFHKEMNEFHSLILHFWEWKMFAPQKCEITVNKIWNY